MSLLTLLAAVSITALAQSTHRPPAVPLSVTDPYFSVWSMGDTLTSVPTRHWTEAPQPMTGLVRIDGAAYRWMGAQQRRRAPQVADELPQKSVVVTPLHSIYTFEGAGVRMIATFMTPLFPRDLDVMSREVTYLTWNVSSIDGKSHHVDVLLDVDPVIAVNDASQQVTWSRLHRNGLTLLNTGSRDQDELNRAGDKIRIDWGYFHLGVPDSAHAITELSSTAVEEFRTAGKLAEEDDISMPRPVQMSKQRAAHLAVSIPFNYVTSTPQQQHILLAYTQELAIEYLGQRLKPYWARNGMTEGAMLAQAEKEYASLEQRAQKLDSDLIADMKRVGGEDYAYLGSLLFRQTIGAHKLVADYDGVPMFFSKENASNGCIDTVDVTYPSAPFFLLFNPELLKAQLEPVMRYASLPRWKFPFAPHDLGTYPLANGQVYGGGEVNEDNQMPVEESANLILLVDALARAEGDYSFAKKYMPQLSKWAEYLAAKGLDPENQLSTDDFAGHLAHNTNLSIKAIEALGAFSQIAQGIGDNSLAAKYKNIASKMPAEWERMAREDDHYRLAFDQPHTWSQKYNLVWDTLLDLHLFSPNIAATEWKFYSMQMQKYGLPLDSRKTYTKLDWEVWTATLTDNPKYFNDLIHRLVVWADNTPSRVPTTDWYDTLNGRQMGFQARSVVGGVFIKALADREIAKRWQNYGK